MTAAPIPFPAFPVFGGFRLGETPAPIDLRTVALNGCSVADVPAAMAALADALKAVTRAPVSPCGRRGTRA